MDQEWCEIEDFPGYSISNHGFVRSDRFDRLVARRVNNRGLVYVGLSRDSEQVNVSVARLVACGFLPPPRNEAFDTPINLDGDRINNRVENLMWRPRWFAIKYYQQFSRPWANADDPVQELETEEEFERSMLAAIRYGLLALDVSVLAWNYTFHGNTWDRIWPTGQQFRSLA